MAEYEAAPHREKSAVLRREGLHQSQVRRWAEARDALARATSTRGELAAMNTTFAELRGAGVLRACLLIGHARASHYATSAARCSAPARRGWSPTTAKRCRRTSGPRY
ncbi:MAG: hypothetical protein M3070_13075 [Actinomycetota bacterium]|nr:hypothetical protein [Actinomycetota bacterium]